MNDAYDDVEDFLSTGGAALTFETIGTTHKGVVDACQVVDDQFNEGKKILRIDLDIDGEIQSLWVRAFGMRKAISAAVAKHGLKAPRPGGTLAVKYTGDGEATQRGWNPPKQFAAQYEPGTQVIAEDVLSDDTDLELI